MTQQNSEVLITETAQYRVIVFHDSNLNEDAIEKLAVEEFTGEPNPDGRWAVSVIDRQSQRESTVDVAP